MDIENIDKECIQYSSPISQNIGKCDCVYDEAVNNIIEKACEWWERELIEVNYETYDEVISAFRKAMKDSTQIV